MLDDGWIDEEPETRQNSLVKTHAHHLIQDDMSLSHQCSQLFEIKLLTKLKL